MEYNLKQRFIHNSVFLLLAESIVKYHQCIANIICEIKNLNTSSTFFINGMESKFHVILGFAASTKMSKSFCQGVVLDLLAGLQCFLLRFLAAFNTYLAHLE